MELPSTAPLSLPEPPKRRLEPPNITWVGCADGNYGPGRAGSRPMALVLHIMEGSLAGTDAWFATPPEKRTRDRGSAMGFASSAGYGVGKGGVIHQYVRDEDRAYHAGRVMSPTWTGIRLNSKVNPNNWTLSIEHEGFANEPGGWPEAQTTASAHLMAWLAQKWSFPLDRLHVCGHHEIFRGKSCPGPNCDLDLLLAMANRLL